MLLTTQGLSTPAGNRKIQGLRTNEEISTLSLRGENKSVEIEKILLAKRRFTSIGIECTRGGSTICHPELHFLAAVPYASLVHSLFLVDCEEKGFGLAQFEKLPISLEEIPFHLMRHPGSAIRWQKLWLLKAFSTEQSRIFNTLRLSLKARMPILSSKIGRAHV